MEFQFPAIKIWKYYFLGRAYPLIYEKRALVRIERAFLIIGLAHIILREGNFMGIRNHVFFVYIYGWAICIILTFVFAGLTAAYSDRLKSETIMAWSKDIKANESLVRILQSENHYFYQNENNDSHSLAELSLKLAANIQPKDVRTFLGRELPGFAIFDTEIVVAGEGTDFTNLPVESAPPLEVLLKEREVATEKLLEEEETPPALTGERTVLIYHSHSWESFMPFLKGVTNSDDAVSSNEKVNVIAVGKKLAGELNKRGIGTIHDTTDMTKELAKRDWPYDHSYQLSRGIVQQAMAANNDLHFLIDVHRDTGDKDTTTKTINEKSYARVFFIVGKEHANFEENLKIATDLHQKIEAKYPGISRGVFKKGKSEGNGIYNQDLSERAILVEFGGVANDLTELTNTVEAFADIFSEYYLQAKMVNG
jgi:stage II sporulation protein P